MRLYRLAIVLANFPDDQLFSGIAAKASELRDLAYSLAALGHAVQLQVLTIDHQIECGLPLAVVLWE